MMRILHTNHSGITRMKQIARKYVYWQGINSDIEKTVHECESCQTLRKGDQKKVIGKWPEPTYPFERVHIDFLTFQGKEFLIFIDAFSRWLEVRMMVRKTADSVLKELMKIFSIFGYAKELVSDNGPPFFGHEFVSKLEALGIKVSKSLPYNPQSNGLVERAVQTTKIVLKKFVLDFKDDFQVREALERFLFNHRNLPCTQEKVTPTERIFSYTPRTELSNLRLDREFVKTEKKNELNYDEKNVRIKQLERENLENKTVREFKTGENVLYISRSPGCVIGLKAIVLKRNSSLTYLIKIENSIRLAHVNQLRKSALKREIVSIPSSNDLVEKSLPRQENSEQTKAQPTTETPTRRTAKPVERPRRILKPIERFKP